MTVLSVAIPLLSYAVVVPAVMTPLCRREKVKRGIGEVGERTGGGRGEIILVKLIQNKFFFGGGGTDGHVSSTPPTLVEKGV